MTTAGWGLIPTVLFVVRLRRSSFGALQGVISTRFRLEPFIVTLAGLQVARGLALVISGNQYINISYGDGPGLAPPVFAMLGDRLFNNVVPVATLVFVVVAVVATFVLNFTRFGRYVFAVGGNERAARLSGVPVTAVKVVGLRDHRACVSAIAGIVHAGQFNFGSANDGTGYELTAIAAVVIGGTSLFGGAGSMVGTVAGAIMLGALANILQLNNINAALQLLATGAIIVLAAVLAIPRPSPRGTGSLNDKGGATARPRDWTMRHRSRSPADPRSRHDNHGRRVMAFVSRPAALCSAPERSRSPSARPTRRRSPRTAGRTTNLSSASRKPTTPSPIASTSMTS